MTHLAISSNKGHPGSCRPPGNDKAEKAGKSGSSALSSPYIYRTTQGERRTNFRKDGGRDRHENESKNVGRPIESSGYCFEEVRTLGIPYRSRASSEQANKKSSPIIIFQRDSYVSFGLNTPDTSNKV